MGLVFLINGTFEKVLVQERISEFKERSQFTKQDGNTYYYRVQPEYDYEDISRNVYNFDFQYIGSTGDIIITDRNPMRDTPLEIPIGFLSKNYYVGHATIVSSDDGSMIYEVLGNSGNPETDIVQETHNTWVTGDVGDTPVIMGLRIKNTTAKQRNDMIGYARSKEGFPYNFTFLLNRTASYYCTDLVSRAVYSAGINVNYDYLATTGNDMIASTNVYIIYLREKTITETGETRYNVYYLS
jgi:uncharacterized protein YycO